MTTFNIGKHMDIGELYYDYREISGASYKKCFDIYYKKTHDKYSKLVSNWDVASSVQWQLRFYLAVKMISLATIFCTKLQYARAKNLLIVVPYLQYYTLLSAARAFIFTAPDIEWKDKITIEMTYQNIINTSANCLARYDKNMRTSFTQQMNTAKDTREIFSYGLPLTGREMINKVVLIDTDVIKTATLLVELAELNSEILHRIIEKQSTEIIQGEPSDRDIELACGHGKNMIFDWDDLYRSTSHFRKFGSVVPLDWMATEGFVDDLFGGWCAEEQLRRDSI